jgi:hypothetical protein
MAISILRLAALALLACWPAAVPAQAPRPRVVQRCEVTFSPVILSQAYNPMSPDDYVASFTATARRSGEGSSANYSALLLRTDDYRLPTEIYAITDDGTGGAGNVLHDRPGPTLNAGLNDAREIDLRFNQPNATVENRTVEMQIRIPAGTAIDPGIAVGEFDVKYLCDYLNGRSDRGTNNRAFTVYFSVSSAVQASLVGAEPDFGEIGTLSNFDVAAAPPSTTQRLHYMRVASTGPYQVDVVSQNGWRMTATGAPSGNAAERIGYRYELLGQRLDSARPNFTPVRCQSSGVSGENIRMTATLTEGGQGKVPSPNYRDLITITITPLAVWVSGTERCD